jgi:hypothetical protein
MVVHVIVFRFGLGGRGHRILLGINRVVVTVALVVVVFVMVWIVRASRRGGGGVVTVAMITISLLWGLFHTGSTVVSSSVSAK